MPSAERKKSSVKETALHEPFYRKRLKSNANADARFRLELLGILTKLSDDTGSLRDNVQKTSDGGYSISVPTINESCGIFAQHWKMKDKDSEIAFKGLLLILEHCLSFKLRNHAAFRHFIECLGYHTVFFWKKAVPHIFDSDFQYGTNYREGLLLTLATYDANTGKNRLRELFAAVPGLRDSLLGQSAKRFQEAYHSMLHRRYTLSATASAEASSGSSEVDPNEDDEDDIGLSPNNLDEAFEEDEEGFVDSNDSSSKCSHEIPTPPEKSLDGSGALTSSLQTQLSVSPPPEVITSSCLTSSHFSERVINVSNAPPVSLRKRNKAWEVGQGSGGLVSCCSPALAQDPSNMWLACFGPDVPFGAAAIKTALATVPQATNTLGLPNVTKESGKDEGSTQRAAEEKQMFSVLKNYSKDTFKLNPVIVNDEDYDTYYGGISNGLLWPALHNLPEYIIKEYDDPEYLKEHWESYIRVNYMFAINAVRNSRPQDFLWIHDYHLMLTGSIIQSLGTHLELGFFLHIPFQPPEEFFSKYEGIGEAILRGILRFTKVGFQTHRDRAKFIELAEQHLSGVKVKPSKASDTIAVSFEGFTSSLGVFPVSIKNEEFLVIANDPETQQNAQNIRKTLLGDREAKGAKLFFSVERFDYTKGIKEKLRAYQRYYELHPERIGLDVFLQVAVTNRRSVETYKKYQDDCIAIAEEINRTYHSSEYPDWKPLIFQTDGLDRPRLVAHYLAMDVGLVTPKKDGMNLVAKEMIICNPRAALVLSDGAGTEQQFLCAGFYEKDGPKLYHRVTDLYDIDEFAQIFYEAAVEDAEEVARHGQQLYNFLLENDIGKWSTAFLDPSWTHEVIQQSPIATLDEFYGLMFQTRDIRRRIVDRILKGLPVRAHFGVSLTNAKLSLEASLIEDTKQLALKTSAKAAKANVLLDVSDELKELELDLVFLNFVENEDQAGNIESFISALAKHHPIGAEQFQLELDEVLTLLGRGEHFTYFFTDRDGTTKSYSCSYAVAIQPCYSAIIQALFAHRCTQYAAILSSAPMLNTGLLDVTIMPDGYYCYGASCGREWYIDSCKKFKDATISEDEQELLDMIQGKINELLAKPEFSQFALIGSGLQLHYGLITIAKQDCANSVDEAESERWSNVILDLVQKFDPNESRLHVYSTQTDIKICLKAKCPGNFFSKGEGLKLFATEMKLDLGEGNTLICGDSESDLPMLEHSLAHNAANTFSIWVGCNEASAHEAENGGSANGTGDLREKIRKLCEQYDNANFCFVACPEVLIAAMAQSTIKEIKIKNLVEDMP